MSTQRRSGRQRAANTRLNDLPDSSPTQVKSQAASRKRKASAARAPAPRRQRRVKSPEVPTTVETEDEEGSENEAIEQEDSDLVDAVVPYLDVSPEPVNAVEKFANEKVPERYGKEEINAFAKICGREWTYYVFEPRIIFGREPEDSRAGEDEVGVHIDLGPAKTVSRNHAQLYFNSHDDMWHISVSGRNGGKINDTVIRKGEDRAIQSGDVIGVAGTQMLFQSASAKSVIHPMFLDRLYGRTNPEGVSGDQDSSRMLLETALPGQVQQHSSDSFPAQAPPSDRGRPDRANGQVSVGPEVSAGLPPRPVTPEPSPHKMAPSSGKKKSPKSRQGIMMESTEQIDYSLDSSKDIKPGCSYAAMITWAIMSTPEEALSLNGIYDWIKAHYAYYRITPSGWQNSIRHNLSLNPAFMKIARRSDEPGKGMKWTLVPEKREDTINSANKSASKAGGRVLSAPGSPAGAPMVSGGFPQITTMAVNHGLHDGQKSPLQQQSGPAPSSSSSSFPPSQSQQHAYHQQDHVPAAPGTSTPPQAPSGTAPQLPVYVPAQGSLPTLIETATPLPRTRAARLPTATDSSPLLNSWTWNSDHMANVNTPAPRAHNLNIPLPTTAKLPTSHMVDSSPAMMPFWRFPDGFGSTPARAAADVYGESGSPQRRLVNGTNSGVGLGVGLGGGGGNAGAGGAWQSSSSPPTTPLLNGADGSPTRKSTGLSSQKREQRHTQDVEPKQPQPQQPQDPPASNSNSDQDTMAVQNGTVNPSRHEIEAGTEGGAGQSNANSEHAKRLPLHMQNPHTHSPQEMQYQQQPSVQLAYSQPQNQAKRMDDDGDEGGAIDLVKGFTRISSYHQQKNNNFSNVMAIPTGATANTAAATAPFGNTAAGNRARPTSAGVS